MEDALKRYHYSDRMKALFLLANNLLEAYEYQAKEDIIHALFDSLEGELELSSAIIGERAEKEIDSARHNLHRAIREFNTGDVRKSREYIARAISNVTTIAEEAYRTLER
jgi:Na+/phosphate symporter